VTDIFQPNEFVTDNAAMSAGELLACASGAAHVVGAASAEGVAVARLLVELGFDDVVLHDLRSRDELRKAFRTTHGA
jgi:hypothetical protein